MHHLRRKLPNFLEEGPQTPLNTKGIFGHTQGLTQRGHATPGRGKWPNLRMLRPKSASDLAKIALRFCSAMSQNAPFEE